MMSWLARWSCRLLLLLLVSHPALSAESADSEPAASAAVEIIANPRDPWEGLNRKIFVFNDTADRYILAPIARGYRWITPDPVETGVGNFFNNLAEITNVANALLQFKLLQAGNDTGRFLLNSTIGLLGFIDVASKVGLPPHREDFGQTLARWGVGSGPYLVVPFFGPYTIRSGAGAITDAYTTDVFAYVDDVALRNSLWATRVISDRASLLAADDLISGDRYSFIRDAYLQRRDFLVNDGQVEDDFGDEDFGDFEDMDDWEE